MQGPDRHFPALLDPYEPECRFPDASLALEEPNGLLAIGGNLRPASLLAAYRRGIFPWYEEGQPVLWWSPDPRLVLFPERLRVSRSLDRVLRRGVYDVSFDRAFGEVVRACGEPRAGAAGTWITAEMIDAYLRLHEMGYAHSVEAWYEGRLAGGLYGVALGRVFFGESMFHRRSDASKAAFVTLVRRLQAWGYAMIDCQMETPHLVRFGAEGLPRARFIELLSACEGGGRAGSWSAQAPGPGGGG